MRGASKELLGEAYTTLHPYTPPPRHRFECGSRKPWGKHTQANTLAFLEQAYGFAYKALLRYA